MKWFKDIFVIIVLIILYTIAWYLLPYFLSAGFVGKIFLTLLIGGWLIDIIEAIFCLFHKIVKHFKTKDINGKNNAS
jgi:hypothetical protein